MCNWILCSIGLSGFFAPCGRCDDPLPVATLSSLKSATVYIKVEKDGIRSTGSGFIVRVDGETAYIVTNHHVVTLVRRTYQTVYRYIPWPGRGQLRLPVLRENEVPIANPAVTVIFSSGERDEHSFPGEVVASDKAVDLAIVKVGPLKGLPEPIDPSRGAELRETRPVFALGFPYGQFLATGKGGPAITVTKGTITSVRRNEHDEIATVQIDSDINPGNSGGPVVDSEGKLVGIAVAKVLDTRIGLAIPPHKLTTMLKGRVGEAKLELSGTREIHAEVDLVDPLNRIGSVELHYAPSTAAKHRPASESLASLKESRKVALRRERQRAIGSFSFDKPDGGELSLVYEVTWVDSDGKTHRASRRPFVATIPSQAGKLVVGKESAPSKDGSSSQRLDAKGSGSNLLDLPRSEPRPAGKALSDAEVSAALKQLTDPAKVQQAAEVLARAKADAGRQAEVAKSLKAVVITENLPLAARCKSVAALGVWGTEEDAEFLVPFAGDENVVLRSEAIEALSWLGGSKAAEAIVDRIENATDHARVLKCLQRVGSIAEDSIVGCVLGSQSAVLRLDGCKLLKTIGTDRSLHLLETMSKDDASDAVRRAAESAASAIKARQQAASK